MPCDDCSRAEICPPCVNGEPMTTTREDLLAMVFPVRHLDETNRRLVEEGVDRLLAKHAHELAERQRAWLHFQGYGPSEETGDGDCPCGGCSWCLAQEYINLIDPKAQA